MATELVAKPKTARQIEAEFKKQLKLLDKSANNGILLNKLLNTNKKLYNEQGNITDKSKLVNLLILLISEHYDFTSEQVNKFFDQAFYTNGYYSNFMGSKITEHKNIITHMLNRGKINDEQLSSILIKTQTNEYYYIYDILFQQKYDFTIEQYKLLRKILYVDIHIDNYDTIHSNVIYAACSYIENNANLSQFDKCIELLHQNEMEFNIEYLNIITNVPTYYKKPMVTILDALFLKHDNSILNIIISNNNSYNNWILYTLIKKFGCDDTLIDYLFNKNNRIYSNPEVLFNLILEGFNCTLSILNKILEVRMSESFLLPINNYYETLNLTLETLEKQYVKSPNGFTIPFINLFEILNIQPDINTLNKACKFSYKNEMDLLLNKYKLIPDHNTLNYCLANPNYDIIHTILNYKITPDSDIILQFKITEIRNRQANTRKIIELLIEFGLIIKINSIEHLLLGRFYLDNLERFDIKYDEELYFLCYLSNYWPVEYVNKFTIDKVILNMHTLCKNRGVSYVNFVNYMKDNNVTLDRYSIDILLNENNYMFKAIYEKHNCIPSILTTYKKCDIPLRQIADLHNITSKDMLEQYKMKI